MKNKANLPWNSVTLNNLFKKEKLYFGNVVQRSYVWELSRRCDLIHSLLDDWPVPPFYARRLDGKIYDMLDGKQRIISICNFMADGYALEGVPPVETEDGTLVDVNGKKYSELPLEMQNAINNFNYVVYYYENLTDEEARIMFKKLNAGKPLTPKERNIANCIDISTFSQIGEHELFSLILTDKAKEARKQVPILFKMYAMLYQDLKDVSFESKFFNDYIESIKTTEANRSELVSILDMVLRVYKLIEAEGKPSKTAKTKLGCEGHLVALTPFFREAVQKGISDILVKDFIVANFNRRSPVSSRYSSNCSGSCAKTGAIIARDEELRTAWNNFFAESEEDMVVTDNATDTEDVAEYDLDVLE